MKNPAVSPVDPASAGSQPAYVADGASKAPSGKAKHSVRNLAVQSLLCAAIFISGAILPGPLKAVSAQAAVLDTFLATFLTCQVPAENAPFSRFWRSLAQRYSNFYSHKDAKAAENTDVAIVVPDALASDLGPITSLNKGEYTLVRAPLKGTFHGLKVQGVEFVLGNENGISGAKLIFDATPAAVRKAFGKQILSANAKGQAEERTHGVGYSALIPKARPARISCDWST